MRAAMLSNVISPTEVRDVEPSLSWSAFSARRIVRISSGTAVSPPRTSIHLSVSAEVSFRSNAEAMVTSISKKCFVLSFDRESKYPFTSFFSRSLRFRAS